MKKILSVLCVLAFIASFACIGASAADAAVTLELVAAPVEEGATTFTVDVKATLPEGGDVTQLGLWVDYPEALKLTACDQVYGKGSFVTSQTFDVKPYMILWVQGTASLPAGESVICTMTFEITDPAAAPIGTTYDITLKVDENNRPAAVDGTEYTDEQVAISGVTAEVVAATVVTTTEATTEATTVATEATEATEATTEATEATTEATEATEATESSTESTKAPTQSSQTGDMMFVVVAVMVVALGAAVVVKKVNVK